MNINELTRKYLTETDDNIVGVGYGRKIKNGILTNEKALQFTVKKKLPIEELNENNKIPSSITYSGETFITDVIEGTPVPTLTYGFSSYDEFYTWMDVYTTPVKPTNRNKIRPLKGGVSLTNVTNLQSSKGTFGFLAKDNEDNTLVGVTNNHVINPNGFIASDRIGEPIIGVNNNKIVQPASLDWTGGTYIDYEIGVVKRYMPWKANVTNNFIDCALTTIDASIVDNSESWKIEGFSDITVGMPFATTQEINDLLDSGANVYAAGRSSASKGEGDTKLKLLSIFYSTGIYYGYGTTVTYNDLIQFIATDGITDVCYESDWAGDSGSVVFADISGTKKIIGLVMAGTVANSAVENPWTHTMIDAYTSAICCRIDRIASQMNISAWTGGAIGYSDKNNIQEYVLEGLCSDPYVIIGGNKYFQAGLTSVVGNTTTTTAPPPPPTTLAPPTPTTIGAGTLSCSATNIFQYAHSTIISPFDGAMYIGERQQSPYIVRFPDKDDLSNYTRVQLIGYGDSSHGLENVCYSSVYEKLYFCTVPTGSANLVIVEVECNAGLSYTAHTFNISAYYGVITTDGTYIYGGADNVFFKIRISDWEIVQEASFYSDFYQPHAAQCNVSRGQVYMTSQGAETKLAIIPTNDIYNYQIVNLSGVNTLTDDMAYYDNNVNNCKVYIGAELSAGVMVDILYNNMQTPLNILPTYGLVISNTTVYSCGISGYIQKFNISNPNNIATYSLGGDFTPNEIMIYNSPERMFITKWAGPGVAKLCEFII